MDPDVPLVVPEVNADALADLPKGIVANPNCTTMVAMAPLKALDRSGRPALAGHQHLSGHLRRGAGRERGAGRAGAQGGRPGRRAGLRRVRRWSSPRRTTSRPRSPSTSSRRPGISSTTARATRPRNASCGTRAARSWTLPELAVSVTCVRVPVFTGHSLSINAAFDRAITADDATAALAAAPGVVLADVPTPLAATGIDPTIVGRIRTDPTVEHGAEPLPLRRQSAQGCRPQRRADRRGRRGPRRSLLTEPLAGPADSRRRRMSH